MPFALHTDDGTASLWALRYTLADFPTTTDRQRYVDEFGNTVWEPSPVNGLWPTNKPIHFIEFLSRVSIPGTGIEYLTLQIRAGQSLATGSFAYGSRTSREKPITGSEEILLSGECKGIIFGLEYGKWIWGPEDWQRRFGESIDKRIGAYLELEPIRHYNIAVGYVRYREIDNKFFAPELGPFDEVILSVSYQFSVQKSLFPQAKTE